MSNYSGIINKYREFLPVTEKTPVISLNEGRTPLIPAFKLSKMIGEKFQVYLKYEGANPTGSFKDRGMTMAISKAVEEGSRAVMCASTGNTSASSAAYAARAGIKSIVLIPEGQIALGKLSQALIHGSTVLAIKGNFDDALKLVKEITQEYPITLVNSINPYRIEGQKTGAFEISEQLAGYLFEKNKNNSKKALSPDYQVMPVGNAGNITAYWKGYKEYKRHGRIDSLPAMLGFQAEGSAPIVRGHVVEDPKTIATAIKIGNPASWQQAVAARDESGGLIDAVSDEEIIQAYKLLANQEGVFAEPASAASVAGLLKLNNSGYFKNKPLQPGRKKIYIVCILTGHGLKDPDRAIKTISLPAAIPAKKEAILKSINM